MNDRRSASGASPGSSAPSRRVIVFRVIVILVALLLGEVFARVFTDSSSVSAPFSMRDSLQMGGADSTMLNPMPGVPVLFRPDRTIEQRWPSNPRGYFDEPRHSLSYRINNIGFRGERAIEEVPRGMRIVVLGDSFCFGLGVREEDLFVHRIASGLAESGRLGGEIEVINMGMFGFNTEAEVALLEQVVLPYKPDMVVIWYFINDWEHGNTAVSTLPFFSGTRFLPAARRWCRLLDVSAFPVERALRERALINLLMEGYADEHAGWQGVVGALGRFAQVCHREGIVPVVAIHPMLIRLGPDYPFRRAHEKVEAQAARLGVPVVDLLPAFRGRKDRELWVHAVDPHPNEVAHRIAGDHFVQFYLTLADKGAGGSGGANRPGGG